MMYSLINIGSDFLLDKNKEIIDIKIKQAIKTAPCNVSNLRIKLSVPTKGRCFLGEKESCAR